MEDIIENKVIDNVGEERDLSLGKKVGISDHYDPNILRAVPRSDNREHVIGLQGSAMPFHGFDIWNCYEFSFLDYNGVPQDYCLKIMYESTSQCIVESKSLKLYLGSFAQENLTLERCIELIKFDLENLLKTRVDVRYYKNAQARVDMTNLSCLNDVAGTAVCTEFQRNPDLLEEFKTNSVVERVCVWSPSLRSNCRVTHQPDEGDVYIMMEGPHVPTYSSLLKYITSFRKEYHFHEEIVETIYADLMTRFGPTKLIVAATYLRRGGISICPVRFSDMALLERSTFLKTALSTFRFASNRD